MTSMSLLYAQDSLAVKQLHGIEIQDKRIEDFQTGEKIDAVSPEYINGLQGGSAAELLMKTGGVNVRSYGISGLSTPSLRGTGSSHTAVIWEGLNLQSPMNGSLDLTLVPVSFISNLSIQYGAAGTTMGSGALGGAIHMSSNSNISHGFGAGLFQQTGSFGKSYTGLNVSYGSGKSEVSVKGFLHHSDNDFQYFNRFSNKEETQENSEIDQHGVLAEWRYQIKDNQRISAKYWYQFNNVNLPRPASAGGEAVENQQDEFHRAVIHWQRNSEHGVLEARSGLVSHELTYTDQVAEPSISQSSTWINEIHKVSKISDNHEFQVGLNYTFDHAETQNYGDNISDRHRISAFLGSKWLLFNKMEVNVSARQLYVDDYFAPFLPSLGVQYFASNHIYTKTKVARSYRIPTFNDLYWKGGGSSGNMDLMPEEGWSFEQGLVMEKSGFKTEITGFYNIIDNWIQWVPFANGWSPQNVEQLQSRGVEGNLSYSLQLKPNWELGASLKYSYTKATKEKVGENAEEQELHKQAIYTPKNQGVFSVFSNYNGVSLLYLLSYTGEQFVTGDNKKTIPSFLISDISLGYGKAFGKQKINFQASVKNAFNKQYEIRNARPMPGRYYQLSIQYQIN
ncbi:TonB-dependent receptor [Fulvivirga ligni]|uniref:TonB-dependent receptor n=1 Tax=Fulvivirga ligni TaxID=2904246 RepID=UPI001F229420|nr:TonB-dependent receptor [Fulvivirga ligni]UII21729.1 TonB-dependent receptor [Fulvivirga ligni]